MIWILHVGGAAAVRAIWWAFGDVPGYIAGGILFVLVAAYWILRFRKWRFEKKLREAN